MRSRRGIYLGISNNHSSTLHIILNPSTSDISAQYHCVFDDHFSTVTSNGDFNTDVWDSLGMSDIECHASIKVRPVGSTHVPPNYIPSKVPTTAEDTVTIPNLPTVTNSYNKQLHQVLHQGLHHDLSLRYQNLHVIL